VPSKNTLARLGSRSPLVDAICARLD